MVITKQLGLWLAACVWFVSFSDLTSATKEDLIYYGTLERPFAETIPDFKTHVMRTVQNQKSRYSNEDIELIAKASRLAMDLFSGGRLSGKTALEHQIGTASCMLHINSPAKYVALGLLHGIYFSFWAEHAVGKSSHPYYFHDDVCGRRRWVREQLGDDMESLLWKYTTQHSGRPEEADPKMWLMMLRKHDLDDSDKHLMAFSICDEIEQYQASEQLWIDNERQRSRNFQIRFLQAFKLLADDPGLAKQTFAPMQSFAASAFQSTNHLFLTKEGRGSYEMEFQNLFEPVFRNFSYIPFVDWAHIPEVRKHLLLCRQPEHMAMCVANHTKIEDWWAVVCCEKGGPCPATASRARNRHFSAEEQAALLLPKAPDLTPNIGYLQCLDNQKCKGVSVSQRPRMSHAIMPND